MRSLSYRLLALWFIWVLCRLCPMPALLTSCLWCSSWVRPTVKPGDEVQNEITKYSAVAHCGNRPITNYIIVILKTGRKRLPVACRASPGLYGGWISRPGPRASNADVNHFHLPYLGRKGLQTTGEGEHKILATATHTKV